MPFIGHTKNEIFGIIDCLAYNLMFAPEDQRRKHNESCISTSMNNCQRFRETFETKGEKTRRRLAETSAKYYRAASLQLV